MAFPIVAQPRPEITLEDDGEVTVRSLQPNSSAGLIGVARDRHGPFPAVFREAAFVLDDDGDGIARARPRYGRKAWSVLIAVDTASGAVGGLADGLGSRELATAMMIEIVDGTPTVSARGKRFHVLVVRPGKNHAWSGVVSDGGGGDVDGVQDGWTSFVAMQLRPLSGEDPENRLDLFADNDVLVLLDDREMAWTAVELDVSGAPRGGS